MLKFYNFIRMVKTVRLSAAVFSMTGFNYFGKEGGGGVIS